MANSSSINALALSVLAEDTRPEIEEIFGVLPLVGARPAELALDLVAMQDADDIYAPINFQSAFGIGFDFALQLGARIALDPLNHPTLADIVKSGRDRYDEEAMAFSDNARREAEINKTRLEKLEIVAGQ